jgi:hypothetical protein
MFSIDFDPLLHFRLSVHDSRHKNAVCAGHVGARGAKAVRRVCLTALQAPSRCRIAHVPRFVCPLVLCINHSLRPCSAAKVESRVKETV